MKAESFCYWLQGYFEVRDASKPGPETLSPEQVAIIKAHLAMVFKHEIDPSLGTPEHVSALQELHDRVEAIEQAPARTPIDPHQRYTC